MGKKLTHLKYGLNLSLAFNTQKLNKINIFLFKNMDNFRQNFELISWIKLNLKNIKKVNIMSMLDQTHEPLCFCLIINIETCIEKSPQKQLKTKYYITSINLKKKKRWSTIKLRINYDSNSIINIFFYHLTIKCYKIII